MKDFREHDPENEITQLLAALRDTEPSSGFEQRLVAVVEQAKDAPPQRRNWMWSLALAGGCAALLLAHVRQAGRQTTAVPAVVATHSAAATVVPAQAAPLSTPVLQATAAPITKSTGAPQAAEPVTISAADQLAQEQTNAPTRVAPPMPLTAAERALLRATRQNDGVNMAQLETMPRPLSRTEAVTQFVQRNLASLAFSEAFNPTPAPEPAPHPDESAPAESGDARE